MASPGNPELRFLETTRRCFAFLLQQGFRETKAAPAVVCYSKGPVEIRVEHDRRTFEISVDICFSGTSYTLAELVRERDPRIGEAIRDPLASTEEGVEFGLEMLSSLLMTYGAPVFQANAQHFEVLKKNRTKWADKYARESLARQLRPEADAAFHRGDYARAADLYGQIKDQLTPAEAKKLVFAEKHRENN